MRAFHLAIFIVCVTTGALSDFPDDLPVVKKAASAHDIPDSFCPAKDPPKPLEPRLRALDEKRLSPVMSVEFLSTVWGHEYAEKTFNSSNALALQSNLHDRILCNSPNTCSNFDI